MNPFPVTPTKRQELVLTCPAFEILFGGAKGGAKSEGLLLMVLLQAGMAHRHWRETKQKSRGACRLARKDYTRMEDLIGRAHHLFKAADPGAEYNVGLHRWTFSSGYRMYFIQLSEAGKEEAQQGQETSLLLIDQAEEIPFKQYWYLRMQVRSSDPVFRGRERIVLTANPIGEHVDWVRERFVEGKKPQVIYEDKVETPEGDETFTMTFIPAKPKDNPHLSKRYWAMLSQLDEDERRAYVDGDWDVVFGSFFADSFKEKTHVVEMGIPRYGDLWMSGDWGSTSPACWHLHGMQNDGAIVTFDEMFGPGITGRTWGLSILDRLKKLQIDPNNIIGYLDDSAWSDYGGETPGETMVQMGLNWFPAKKPPNSRPIQLVALKSRLRHRCGTQGRLPGWMINSHCEHIIKDLKLAVKDDKKPNDVAGGGFKLHALASARYGITPHPLPEESRVPREETMGEWERNIANRDRVGGMRNGKDFAGYG